MVDEKIIKSTVRIPEGLYWQFQEMQAKNRVSNEVAIREAIQKWIEGETSTPPSPMPKGNRYQQMLAHILTSKNRDAISAVQQNLEVFFKYIHGKETDIK